MTYDFDSPLSLAVATDSQGRIETLKTLIRHGASPIRVTPSGTRHLDINSPEVLDAYLEAGLHIDTTAQDGTTLLMLSLQKDDDPDLTQAFINRGADVNRSCHVGLTALGIAASVSATSSFALLLKAGAKPELTTTDGSTFDDLLAVSSDEIRGVLLAFHSREAINRVVAKRPANSNG